MFCANYNCAIFCKHLYDKMLVRRLTWQLGGPGVGGGHYVQRPHIRGLGGGPLIIGVVSNRVVTLVNSSANILVTYFVLD